MLLLTPSVSGLFKWRQFEPEVILLAVGWYLRFSLSYRDVEGVARRARTFGRPRYSLEAGTALRPGNERRLRSRLIPTNGRTTVGGWTKPTGTRESRARLQ
jgi:hypothetical protein